jgi:hypothetical protein
MALRHVRVYLIVRVQKRIRAQLKTTPKIYKYYKYCLVKAPEIMGIARLLRTVHFSLYISLHSDDIKSGQNLRV